MKKDDVEPMLSGTDLPAPRAIKHQQELKIPLLSYRKSSRAGLWLLILPVTVAVTMIVRYELGIASSFLDLIHTFFGAVDRNAFLTYLIPVVFVGLPLLAMTINLLAFCHSSLVRERKELFITIKLRPMNIALFLTSFAILLFFLLPDKLSF